MLSTWIQSKKDEEGFTLIELLVVVIIIGILAAIAIPVFLNQREGAWTRAAQSDLRNASVTIETHFSAQGTYAGAAGWRQSPDVTVTLPAATSTAYCLQAVHAKLDAASNTFKLDSATGTVSAGAC